MTPQEFLAQSSPGDVDPALAALWYDARGDWHQAHQRCQEASSRDGDWVHAYLHRKEGDLGNSSYWYAQAGRSPPGRGMTLEAEWTAICSALLSR